jgi:uncharacterized membrane protein
MIFKRSIRHHTLRADTLLPFFDSVFGAALTLLVFDVPSMLDMSGQYQKLFTPILIYCLTGLIVILYWFRLRRLIGIARFLHVPQLLCLGQAMLAICLFPKLSNLVLLYGSQPGSIFELSQGQIVNMAYLFALFLFNSLCFVFAWSLASRHSCRNANQGILRHVMRGQLLGFGFLVAMVVAVIFSDRFNNEYIYLVPIVIVVEEGLVAAQFSGLRS